jgi:DNA polymerase IV
MQPDEEFVSSPFGQQQEKRQPRDAHKDELSTLMNLVRDKIGSMNATLVDEDEEDDILRQVDEHDSGSGDDGGAGSSEDERHKKRQRQQKEKASTKLMPKERQEKFQCMQGGTKDCPENQESPNARTIEVLQQMLEYYEAIGDHWRIMSYRRGISVLKNQTSKISNYDEAIILHGIGDRLAAKIEEISLTDTLQKLEYAQQEPIMAVLGLFLKIHGVGLAQAHKWISQGYRTLDDLRTKAKLTSYQQVGLDHYDDLNMRIPRAEVTMLGDFVRGVARDIDREVQLIIGGSYRRGSESSGDIDLIVTKKETNSSDDLVPFLDALVAKLYEVEFLTCTLSALSHNVKRGHGSIWHGCCALPGPSESSKETQQVWRRIDFLLVPESEMGAALIYFTGNDIFNRSIRLLAGKKGMRLNQRGLWNDPTPRKSRVHDPRRQQDDLLEGRDERRIFELLGVTWREPAERWC